MAKHNRYLLTERQLSPVIRYINENYPAGINDFNFDRMSGADRPSYDKIQDVTLKPDGSLIIDIATDNGRSVEKVVWLGEDNIIKTIEAALPKYGYDVTRFPEWEVINATVSNGYIILDIGGDGHTHQVAIGEHDVMQWVPELADSDLDELSVGRGW
jgi:hypothetical protein